MKTDDKNTSALVLTSTAAFISATIFFFIPAALPHKVTLPAAILTIASIWLCPWEITLALLFSAIGDYFGSCENFIGQMGSFAIAHIWFIVYFIKRYFKKVEQDKRLTVKAKGYLAMVVFCTIALLATAFFKIAPGAEPGAIRIGVCIYSGLIGFMMLTALLQRSSLFALGAVLFVFSDFILAWNMFVEPVPGFLYIVMVPYFLAQWLIFIRATKFRIGPEMRILRF